MSNELLMYSRHVDELINEVMKNPTEENKSNLRDAQQELDRKVLGRKAKARRN